MATPNIRTLSPRGHEIYNFGRPFLGHHNFILSVAYQCLAVEKNIFKRNNAFSLYDIWPRSSTRTATPGVMKVTISVDPSSS